MGYAKGKFAYGFSDRSGRRYPLSELVYEVQDGVRTGFRVGRDELDPDHPQNHIGRVRTSDDQSLRDPRPDRALVESRGFFGWAPVGNTLTRVRVVVGSVTVATGD